MLFAFSGIYTPWLCPKRIGRCPYALAEIIFCMIITLKDNSETPSCRPPSLLFILQRYIKLGITPKEITTFLKVFSERQMQYVATIASAGSISLAGKRIATYHNVYRTEIV